MASLTRCRMVIRRELALRVRHGRADEWDHDSEGVDPCAHHALGDRLRLQMAS